MQKKIIALAIAAAASAGVIAQSNVQIYGLVDYGYTYRHDRSDAGKAIGVAKSNSKLDGGQAAGNRIGFKGVEDLGNGLKAVFVLERGFALENGTANNGNGGNGFNRQAYVGLSSANYGTLVGGLVYTPYYTLVSSIDPFADGTVGQYSNVKRDINGLFNPVRVENTIAYISPSWGGFSITAAFSNNALNNDSTVSNSDNDTVYALAANYNAKNWFAGLSYHHIAAGQTTRGTGAKTVDDITIGGAYDFKVVKVSAFLSYDKAKLVDGVRIGNKSNITQTNFLLGAVAPFGKHAVKGSINYSQNSSSQFGKAWQFAVGYDYNFSKRTNFYAAYSFIDNDDANNNGRMGRNAVVGDATNGGGFYQQAFQLGIKHTF